MREPQVKIQGLYSFVQLKMPVHLNDDGSGGYRMRVDVCQTCQKGALLVEVLQIRCIHGEVCEYHMLMAQIQVAGWLFRCSVGVVPHLNSPVLLGLECSVLN